MVVLLGKKTVREKPKRKEVLETRSLEYSEIPDSFMTESYW